MRVKWNADNSLEEYRLKAAPLGLFQINLEILAYLFSGIITLVNYCGQFLLVQYVSNKGKVPKGSCGIAPLNFFLLHVMTKRDQFVTSKKMAKIVLE